MTDNFSYLIDKIIDNDPDNTEYYEDDISSISISLIDHEILIPSDEFMQQSNDRVIIQNKSISNYILIKPINEINQKNT